MRDPAPRSAAGAEPQRDTILVTLKRSLGWLILLTVLAVWIFLAQGMGGKIATASMEGLFRVFSWPAFGYLLLGNAVGFAVGMLPGLGGPVTMALMLGFAFQLQMDAVEAFAFLLGMMAVTATTGDITSILFGIPGEGSTASTIVEGHPMAKKGEAGRALGASLMSSLMGAIIGAGAIGRGHPHRHPAGAVHGHTRVLHAHGGGG